MSCRETVVSIGKRKKKGRLYVHMSHDTSERDGEKHRLVIKLVLIDDIAALCRGGFLRCRCYGQLVYRYF